ncbi:MAG: VOC family protein [Solirubrobacterales bacterium]|nr:VOC family protein [Solirubrobacterales bacterium]MBV9714819.1 VOC family protein [Solirubrobacterales bacterium]
MGERTEYQHGTFSWSDLATTDQEAAKVFYCDLFGWETVDFPVGDGITYTMARLDGKDVAAISPQPQQQRDAGAPPAWQTYITVDSADRALARAGELGATIHAPAFDVMDQGRMGVAQDPQGAYLAVWEPKAHIGARLVNAPGALSWNELATPDLEAASRFYGELFGWTFEAMEGMEMPYRVIRKRDGSSNGGMRPTTENEPPYWLVYFGTDNIDKAMATAGEHGGTALMGPMDIGAGKIAAIQDPQGAVFALFAGNFDA